MSCGSTAYVPIRILASSFSSGVESVASRTRLALAIFASRVLRHSSSRCCRTARSAASRSSRLLSGTQGVSSVGGVEASHHGRLGEGLGRGFRRLTTRLSRRVFVRLRGRNYGRERISDRLDDDGGFFGADVQGHSFPSTTVLPARAMRSRSRTGTSYRLTTCAKSPG